jgi:hypothetical protein
VVKACDYELNNRKYQRKTNKDTLVQQAIVQRLATKIIKESYAKVEHNKIIERSKIIRSTVFKEDAAQGDEYQPIKLLSSQSGSNKGGDQVRISEQPDQQSG